MMRLWMTSYAKTVPVASSATLSVAAHAMLIAAWVYVTLPPPGMPVDGLANRLYPVYIPPPNHVPGSAGSQETLHFIKLPMYGSGTGDGPHQMGDARPTSRDRSRGKAPIDSTPSTASAAVPGKTDSVFTVVEVDSAVSRAEDSAAPSYPPDMLAAHIMGSVMARYVVDTTGRADTTSFEVVSSTNPEFVDAVRGVLPLMRFNPAKIGTHKVRQLVEQTFSFRIAEDSTTAAPAPPTSAPPAHQGPPGGG